MRAHQIQFRVSLDANIMAGKSSPEVALRPERPLHFPSEASTRRLAGLGRPLTQDPAAGGDRCHPDPAPPAAAASRSFPAPWPVSKRRRAGASAGRRARGPAKPQPAPGVRAPGPSARGRGGGGRAAGRGEQGRAPGVGGTRAPCRRPASSPRPPPRARAAARCSVGNGWGWLKSAQWSFNVRHVGHGVLRRASERGAERLGLPPPGCFECPDGGLRAPPLQSPAAAGEWGPNPRFSMIPLAGAVSPERRGICCA